MSERLIAVSAVSVAMFFAGAHSSYAQSVSAGSGTVRGSVQDPSGAAIPGAAVQIQNPVSHYSRSASTDAQGNFELDNIPYNNYHASATSTGFAGSEQDLSVHSPVPVELKFTLTLGVEKTSVTVTEAGDLLATDSSTHTDLDRLMIDKLPLEGSTSSLSSLVTLSTPGISADSNGLFHGLGDHASNSFSLDGQPITDQQSKVFSNQLPVDAVQSMEVIEGAPPAEYGGKTSVVMVVTTRSGLGATEPHGDVTTSYGSFGTSSGGFDLVDGGKTWGNFISISGTNTGRFLDGPEFTVMHDHGNEENVFDRIDFKLSSKDSVNLNLGFTRSWFQVPNSYDAQNATAWNGLTVDTGGLGPNGQAVGSEDQRAKIQSLNIAPAWTRLIGSNTVLTFGGYLRQDQFNYYPSRDPFADYTPDLQLQTIGQNRRLTNAGARTNIAYVKGIHNLKAGVTYQHTFITERDSLGVVDPALNAPCLYAGGAPDTSPSLTNPAGCSGSLQANPAFVPILGCYDLTRTATLPASDGCATAASGMYKFYGHADIKELGLFVQDTLTIRNWSISLGLREDVYNGLAYSAQIQPRLGLAYNFKPTHTVIRASYARTMETPFNENLVLASTGCNDPVISALESLSSAPCAAKGPEGPGWRNEFHAGIQQALGRFLVVDAEYIWKYTHRAFDFSVLGNTPITFPIEWISSKIPGYAVRATMPNFHGFTAYTVFSSVAARFFTPQVSGIGAVPGGSSVFRIDHDERFNQTTHAQYQPWKDGPWLGFTWRYDSGQVAGSVPCAGGNCANGPNGTDTIVDASGLTPNQQFEAGLFCGSVHATPTTPISPNGLCAAAQYGSTLLSIPAAGTENDDHNPPRIASRNLFDVALGDDNIFHGEKKKWSARITVVNVTNKEALYNFLSTFSGTHYVSPRTVSATIAFHF
jgi:hypothetical protein